MKDYKALIQHKETKERKIVYMGAHSTEGFKTMILGTYPQFKIIKANVNRDSRLMYYCNDCQKEIKASDKNEHLCKKKN